MNSPLCHWLLKLTDNKIKVFSYLLFATLFFTHCAEVSLTEDDVNVPVITIDCDKPEVISDLSDIYHAKIIEIPFKIGNGFYTIHLLNNGSFLYANSREGRVILTDKAGKIVWTLSSGDGPGEFKKFRDVSIPVDQRTIILWDDFQQYIYDLNGNLVKKIAPPLDYADVFHYSDSLAWYAAAAYNNSQLTGGTNNYQLYQLQDEDYVSSLLMQSPLNPSSNFVDYQEFIWSDSTLFYNKQFYDTTYQITKDGLLSPEYTVSYANKKSTQSFLKERPIESAARFFSQENIARTKFTFGHKENIHTIYTYNGKRHLSVNERTTGQTIKNCYNIQLGDVAYEVPFTFSNNTLIYVTYKYKHQYQQKLLTNKNIDQRLFRQGLTDLEDKFAEEDTALLVLLRMKIK